MSFETVGDITITYTEDGIDIIKELDKAVLTKGAWSTIVFRYQEWDRRKEAYSGTRFSVRRYQKRNGVYQQKSKFAISSIDQAQKMIAILQDWMAKEEG